MSEINETKKDRKKDKRFDLIAKILCFFFAFLLWFYVMIVESPGDERVIRDVQIQIDMNDQGLLSKGLSVYAENTETLDVTLSGKRRVLSRITAEDIEAKADLRGVSFAGTDISVPVVITPPDGCELVSATKYSVRISVDSVKKALIPLRVELLEKNPDYLYDEAPVFSRVIDGETVEYTSVTVEGPSSMVSLIDSAVVKVDVSDKSREFTEVFAVELTDKNGNVVEHSFLKKEFDTVNVTMAVNIEKTVPLSVLFKQDYFADSDTRVTIEPAEVTVICAPADAERMDLVPPLEIDEKKLLNEESIQSHYFETICYPVSAYGSVISPSFVKVAVQIDEDFNNRRMNITEINSTNGMEIDCNILDDSIENVIVCGRTDLLSTVKPNDIVAVVDLSDYSAENIGKRYTKKVTFVIDSEAGDEVFIVGDYTVEIEITEK